MAEIATRSSRLLRPSARFDARPDGVVYVHSTDALGPYPVRLTDRLHHWAETAPDRTFLAWRGTDACWARLTYGDALLRVRSIARSLLERRLSPDRTVLILSGNSCEHALLALAAMYCGIPYAPIAPAYALVPREFDALRALWQTMRPGLVLAAEGPAFERALAAMPAGSELVTCVPPGSGTFTPFAALESAMPSAEVDDAHRQVNADTVAKVLFTSESTGTPKGVINTQRMLCANQEMLRTVMGFLADTPPVLCDWLPWNHTFGGNHNFGIVLYNGGTLYIDEGRPVPGAFDATLRNLREVASTAYFNVPKGYEMLLPHLRADEAFRRHFFSPLSMLFYAAAGLRQQTADELDALALETCGERIPWVTGLGATESAPFALCTGPQMTQTVKVGLPAPGVELKIVPAGAEYEARLRGPNITPGFWRDDALTRASFDEEGFYKLGDALVFHDPADWSQGFVFRGRLGEDFKLSSGTWVRVGPLRVRFLTHFGALVQDVAFAGPNRDYVVALIFPNIEACRALLSAEAPGLSIRDVLHHPQVVRTFRRLLDTFTSEGMTSSTLVARARLLHTSPSFEAREITDKGSLNQKAVLAARAALVDEMYDDTLPMCAIDRKPETPEL